MLGAVMLVFTYAMATIGVVVVMMVLLALIFAYWYDIRISFGKGKDNGKAQTPK